NSTGVSGVLLSGKIERIVAEAMARTDQKLKTAPAASIVGRSTRTESDLTDAHPVCVRHKDLFQPLAVAKTNIAVSGLPWPAVMPIISTLPPVEPFIPEL